MVDASFSVESVDVSPPLGGSEDQTLFLVPIEVGPVHGNVGNGQSAANDDA